MPNNVNTSCSRLKEIRSDNTLMQCIVFGRAIGDLHLVPGSPAFSYRLQHGRMTMIGMMGLGAEGSTLQLCPEWLWERHSQAAQGRNDMWISLVKRSGKQ